MAAGLVTALDIYFNTYFWELSSTRSSMLALANFVSAAVAFAIAPPLSVRLGKKHAAIDAASAVVCFGPMPVMLRLLGALPRERLAGAAADRWRSSTRSPSRCSSSPSILLASMVADVVEDSEVQTGRRSEGIFFAANSFVQKSVSGIGIFTSTLLLRAIGFPRGARPGTVDPAIVQSLGLVFTPTVIVLLLIALGFLASYRISRERHEENLATLGRRAAD